MTAHRPKPTITPEIVGEFAAHWFELGPLHVILDDGNWHMRAADGLGADATPVQRRLAAILDGFTESQRSRLAKRARRLAMDPCSHDPRTEIAPRLLRITGIDPTAGTVEVEPIE